jgi:hypothetical protein
MPAVLEEPTSLAGMLAADAAEAPPEAATLAPETPQPEVEETPEVEAEAASGEEEEVLSENPILDYYREQFPDDASIAKYATDDEFLKGYQHAQKLVGQRENAVDTIRYLEQEGVTARELAEWVQQRNQAPAGKQDPLADPDYFDPAWVVENDKGEWVATAAAPRDIAERATRYRQQIAARLRDPALLAKEVMKHLTPEVQKMIQGSQAQAAAALAQRDEAQIQADFIDRHATVLIQGGKYAGNATAWNPIAHRVTAIAQELNPQAYPSLNARLERALAIAALETTPKPNGAKLPAAAKHVAAPAVPAKGKMSIDDFEEAWPDATMSELMAAFPDGVDKSFSGKAPGRPRAKKK